MATSTAPPASAPEDRHGQPKPSGPTRVGRAPVAPGSTPAAEGENLPLPHERDEAAGNTAARPDDVMRQARKDLDAGMVDTDMRATPGLDAEHRKQLTGASPPHVEAPIADSTVGPGSQPKAPRTDRPGEGRRR